MHNNHLTPTFSIVTVCYNAEAELEDTIQSVIAQTYRHVEYIIVDGASKDGTLAIIERYKGRIARVVSEPDKGLYDAMNKGLRLATGDYVCFLNAGDCFHEDSTLQRMADTLTKAELPDVLDTAVYDEIYTADSGDAFAAAKLLAKTEGISVGISSGAALYGAIELAKRPENKGKVIVALLPDSGDRYYSTALFTE